MNARDEQARQIAEKFPGPRGPKGDRGERGKRGEPLTWAQRRAFGYLFIFVFVLIGILGVAIFHYVEENIAQRCGSLAAESGIPVPVPTSDNPARTWIARDSLIKRHKGEELGCKMPPMRFAPAKPGS